MAGAKEKRVKKGPEASPPKIGIIGGSGLYSMSGLSEVREVRVKTAELQATLAVPLEGERRLHQVPDRPAVGPDRRVAAVGLAVVAREGRLVIKCVDVARPTVHEQEHGVLGLGGKVGLAWARACRTLLCVGRTTEETVAREQVDERQAGEAPADLPEELAAGAAAGGMVGGVAC